ncbi:HDOD domain-containing protein [Thiomicrorhabdus sp. ZW0627]|uniref:HDOD domain-containing protein n=1 Tax=Thiomicrorhabdus sp. ZW0627 TaxID=3039774 RepID=UPI002436E313|nr:HDOD domain-containing protein [Thiomicrorhabdus sp. ZW0627]MDG6774141.1 HDOD domain-containing protein [Thiomicrorhabdus sp. ZW0627]
MQQKLKNAVEAIRGVKIPELPDEVLLLEKEIKSKFANISTVAEIIEKNTTLSGELMKIVNSPIMKLKEPCKSIRDAVNVMGLDNIYHLVVSAAVKNIFGQKGLFKDIMDHSVDVAFCMADIAEWVDDVSRDEAYMLGLFHNSGAMMLASKNEEMYAQLFSNSMSLPVSIIAKEEQLFGTNHAMVGVLIAKKWHLPMEMINAIMLHHNESCERIQNDKVRAMVAMIKIANSIVSEVSLGAYRGDEMRRYEKDGIDELMIPAETVKEIRTALMSYSYK